jgi:quinol monooxygenase YgiN
MIRQSSGLEDGNMTICRTAEFVVYPEQSVVFQAAVNEYVAYVDANEPGTLIYLTLRQGDDPSHFEQVIVFESHLAERIHDDSAALLRFHIAIEPLVVNGIPFEDFSLLAGIMRQSPSVFEKTAPSGV